MPRHDQSPQPNDATRRARTGGAHAIIAAVCLALTLAACDPAAGTNELRLHVLQQDPVLRCTDGLAPNGVPVDQAGSRSAFGPTQTSLARNFLLSADANRVTALSDCVTKAGWPAAVDPVSKPSFIVITGQKRFESAGSWTANLRIFIDQQGLISMGGQAFRHGPTVSVQIDTQAATR